jgi:tetratricopeptide (TPR) repeat protein
VALLDRVARVLGDVGAWDGLMAVAERMAAPDGAASRGLQAALLCSAARYRRTAGRPWTEIERNYRQALERDPQCLEALDGLAEVYGELSADEQLAVVLVQRSECGAEVGPRVQALLRAVGVLAQRLHRPQEALPLLQRALELRPEDHQVLRTAADLHQLTGDLAQAEEALVALAELGSDPEESLNRACGLARRRGDAPAEALYLSHLARLRPESRTSLRLVRAYRAAGDLRGLSAVLEQLSQQDPEAMVELARLQAGPLENPVAAHDAYRRCLEQRPDHREALEAMVELCDQLGKPEETVTYLRRLRDVTDGERRLYLSAKLARREEELGLLERAEQSWRAALNEAPGDPALILGLSENLRRQQRWDALCVHLEQHLSAAGDRLDPESRGRLAALLGEVYLDHADDPEAGIRWLSSACSLVANDTAYRRLLSLHRQRQDFLEAAELILQRIRQLAGGERAHLWRELGYIQEIHLKDLAMAASSYAAAYRESPQADLHVASAAVDLYLRAGEAEPALTLLEEMLAAAEEPARAPLLAARARVLVARGEIPAAIEEYEHALRRDPQLYGAHAELGQQLFSRGQFGAALPHLLAAAEHIEDAREAAHCAFLAARTLEKLGLASEAIARYELAIARDPTNRASHEALLPHYQSQGLWEKLAATLAALGSLTSASAMRAPLLARLAEVELRLGRTDAAAASYDRALELDPQLVDALTGARQLAQARQDWRRCADLLAWELPASADPRTKARLHRQLAQLFDGPLDDIERAVGHYTAALELEEHDDETGLRLLPLLERSARLERAARLSERLAGRMTIREDRRALLLRAARNLQHAGLHDERARLEREAATLLQSLRPAAATSTATNVRCDVGDLAMTDDWHAMMDGYRARAATRAEPHERAELLLLLARNLEEKFSRPLEALAVYSEACAVAHDYLPAIEAHADAAYRNQDWHLARELYDRLWKECPVQLRPEIFYRRALVYETLGDEATADSCYAQTITLDPTHRTALEGRARLALYRDDVSVAIETLSVLVRLISVDEVETLADMREQLGKLYRRSGRLDAAQQYLESALALDSQRTKTMQSLLGVYESQGNFAGMVNLLQQLICLTPDPLVRASLLHHRAEILGARLGDEEAAVDDLLKAYDLAPEYPPTLWRLIDYYWEQRDLESVAEMGAHLQSAMALEEKSPDQRHVRLAAAMLYRDEPEKARPLLEVALSNAELLEPALLDLGRIVAAGGVVDPLVALIHAADPAGALLQAGALLLGHSAPPGVPELIAALRRISTR